MSGRKKLRSAVVGCGMGSNHAENMFKSNEFELVSLCDLKRETAVKVAANTGEPEIFTEYEKMLAEMDVDVIVIATPTLLHASMTLKAIDYNVKGIYCEKPMTVDFGEAKRMVKTCKEKGVALVVGHQRRMNTTFQTMRDLIEDGIIGDVYLMRGLCAGDFLSDGTHTVDTIRHLNGDSEADFVLGQVHRDLDTADKSGETGKRFGHAVESGAMSVMHFVNGVRAEIFTGDLRVQGYNEKYPGWAYQDIEILGTEGRLWRNGDGADPQITIWDKQAGGWRGIEIDKNNGVSDFVNVFDQFAYFIKNEKEHPLNGKNALKTHELVMAVYESARLNKKIELPLQQDHFPLKLMEEEERL